MGRYIARFFDLGAGSPATNLDNSGTERGRQCCYVRKGPFKKFPPKSNLNTCGLDQFGILEKDPSNDYSDLTAYLLNTYMSSKYFSDGETIPRLLAGFQA